MYRGRLTIDVVCQILTVDVFCQILTVNVVCQILTAYEDVFMSGWPDH